MKKPTAVVWRDAALDDLVAILDWLDTLPLANPKAVRRKIDEAIGRLEQLGDVGRPGQVEGTRELLVQGAPYIFVYVWAGDAIEIIALLHMAGRR